MPWSKPDALVVVDPEADRRYAALIAERGLDPDGAFEGRYAEWEWNHGRHMFDSLVEPAEGKTVLEFGCHYGGTAVVLAALGAKVTAIDPDAACFDVARVNAARYGVEADIQFLHVPDTRRMPFESASFDWVSCNGVLDYVPRELLADVQAEIGRVLKPGGLLFAAGTSNRLWPREVHTRRWLVNYLPRALDGLLPGPPPRRGVSPAQLLRGFGDFDDLTAADGGRLYVEMKTRTGLAGPALAALSLGGRCLDWVGLSPGMLAPSTLFILRKRTSKP